MKNLCLTALAVMVLAALSSCLRNEEPDGIKNLRDATAELLKAEAQYQTAQIALVQADANLKAKANEGKKLENEMKEIDIRDKELDIQYREAEIAHEKKLQELELALEQQKNEKEIAAIRNEIFELEVQKLDIELKKLKKEQEKEIMIKTHEEEMIDAQLAVKQAEADYQEALRNIAAAAQGLTAEEQDKLNGYYEKINGIREDIHEAEISLIQAQSDYVDAKYSYDVEHLTYTYQTALTRAERILEADKDALEKAESLDLKAGTEAWIAQRDQIAEEIRTLEADIADLEIKAKEKELEKTEPQKQQLEIEKQLQDADSKYYELETELGNVYDRIYGEVKEVRLDISPEISYSNDNGLIYGIYSLVADHGGYGDLMEHSFQNNVITWLAAEEKSLVVINEIRDLLESYGFHMGVTMDNFRETLEVEEYRFESSTGSKAVYLNDLRLFEEAVEESRTLSEQYGILNGMYMEETLLTRAVKAYEELVAASDPTEAQISTWIEAIYREQQVRDALSGKSYLGWEDLTLENYTSDPSDSKHITNDDLRYAVEYSLANSIENHDYFDSGSDRTKWSANEAWNKTSVALYGISGIVKAFGDEYPFEGRVSWEYYPYTYEHVIWYSSFVHEVLAGLGYPYISSDGDGLLDCPELVGSEWYRYTADSLKVESLRQLVGNFDGYVKLYEDVCGICDEKAALEDQVNAESLDIMKQMKDVVLEKEDLTASYNELSNRITEIDGQIDDMVTGSGSQKGIIESHIDKIGGIRQVLDDLIADVQIVINGVPYAPDDAGLQAAYDSWLISLQDKVKASEEDVRLAQADLDRLLASEDPAKFAVDTAAKKLEQAEERHSRLVEEFNLYNGLLEEFISQLTA